MLAENLDNIEAIAVPELRIFVEQFPNKNMREFHVSIPVVDAPFSRYGEDPIPEPVQKLEDALIRCPSVGDDCLMGRVRMKSIRVEINKAFTWDECIEDVIDVLEQFYGRTATVSKGERDPEWDKPQRNECW